EEAGRVVRDVMLEGFRQNVDLYVFLEPVYRFPVLAHWSFTVSGTGGFEPLMQALDVGLLGTAPKPPVVPPRAPPPPPAPPPPAPPGPRASGRAAGEGPGGPAAPHAPRRGGAGLVPRAAGHAPDDARRARRGRPPALRPRERPAPARRARRPRGPLARRRVRDRPAARALPALDPAGAPPPP